MPQARPSAPVPQTALESEVTVTVAGVAAGRSRQHSHVLARACASQPVPLRSSQEGHSNAAGKRLLGTMGGGSEGAPREAAACPSTSLRPLPPERASPSASHTLQG